MSKVLDRPDFSKYSFWPSNKGLQGFIDRIKELTGVEISKNRMKEAIWPRDKSREPELIPEKMGPNGGGSMALSDRKLVEWIYSIVEGG